MDWNVVAERGLRGAGLTRAEGLAAVRSADDDLLPLLHAAYRVRSHHHGRRVHVNVLNNAKSGACSEDCTFCSQSVRADTEIPQYPLRTVDELVEGARQAAAAGAVTYCMVTSMARPSRQSLQIVCEATREIKQRWSLRVCASLGLLTPEAAAVLRQAGVDRYNHNLEASEKFFPRVCTTHRYEDRVETVRVAQAAGMDACCGGIVGLGETPEDRVDLALTLRELGVMSIPVNFLDPRPGTVMEGLARPTPADCLRALALFRLANPQAVEVRAAGGREACLGALQPLALFAADSLFANGYLTTPGQGLSRDLKMIRDAGFQADLLQE